ncbi:excisionase [Bradyrhizobium japonicum]|uniref:excisionase n=1 Tax=Bradyrhizobium japonicum TaxID=375 RepID=UPI002012B305|nr:excisionase [Bradyrhizobium japonicum]
MSSTADQIPPDAPLRLSVAAKLAFPDGSMTASGLRREAARGRLELERIAGKDYTTLDAIMRMREQCRVQAKELGFTNEKRDMPMENSFIRPFGSSRTETAISPRDALRARLKKSRPQKPSKP